MYGFAKAHARPAPHVSGWVPYQPQVSVRPDGRAARGRRPSQSYQPGACVGLGVQPYLPTSSAWYNVASGMWSVAALANEVTRLRAAKTTAQRILRACNLQHNRIPKRQRNPCRRLYLKCKVAALLGPEQWLEPKVRPKPHRYPSS